MYLNVIKIDLHIQNFFQPMRIFVIDVSTKTYPYAQTFMFRSQSYRPEDYPEKYTSLGFTVENRDKFSQSISFEPLQIQVCCSHAANKLLSRPYCQKNFRRLTDVCVLHFFRVLIYRIIYWKYRYIDV